jgi:hypothetical protein
VPVTLVNSIVEVASKYSTDSGLMILLLRFDQMKKTMTYHPCQQNKGILLLRYASVILCFQSVIIVYYCHPKLAAESSKGSSGMPVGVQV